MYTCIMNDNRVHFFRRFKQQKRPYGEILMRSKIVYDQNISYKRINISTSATTVSIKEVKQFEFSL